MERFKNFSKKEKIYLAEGIVTFLGALGCMILQFPIPALGCMLLFALSMFQLVLSQCDTIDVLIADKEEYTRNVKRERLNARMDNLKAESACIRSTGHDPVSAADQAEQSAEASAGTQKAVVPL